MRWLLVSLAVACGSDPAPECRTSFLSYDDFGEPFIANWCRGCHSEGTLPGMRQGAPVDVNFDTLVEVRSASTRVVEMAGTGSAMPPAGGPTDQERAMLVEWITCGAN